MWRMKSSIRTNLKKRSWTSLKNNPNHYTVKNLHKYRLTEEGKLLLLVAGSEFIKGVAEIDLDDLLKTILYDAADRFRIKRDLIKGTDPLVKKEANQIGEQFLQ